MKIFQGVLELLSLHYFHSEIFKRELFCKEYSWRYSTCSSAHRLVMLYICTRFHESVSDLLGGHKIMTDGQTNGWTDGKTDG